MIFVQNIKVYNITRAIYSARNAMNSWDKSDSDLENDILGSKDLELARKLYKAGSEHRKYLRQIFVSMDIIAPLYWISEFDTYKIGVIRNSCSFMHKGVSKLFEITDFSIHDDRIYEILSPLEKKEYPLIYKYNTDEYRIYRCSNGRRYKIYKNGRIFSEPFSYTDTMGRVRCFGEKECFPSRTSSGYYELNIGGASAKEEWQLHRLIATVWIENPNNFSTVNHKDGNKGNNCVENLEWSTREDNIKKGFQSGMYANGKSIHARYIKWKNGHTVVPPYIKAQILYDKSHGSTYSQIADKYNITKKQANNIMCQSVCEMQNLFLLAYSWENIINTLNKLREVFLETKDDQIFQQIRCLLPCGYNQRFTVTMNYENVFNIIHQRSGHKLDEWRDFVEILKDLPYVREIMGEKPAEDEQLPRQITIDEYMEGKA